MHGKFAVSEAGNLTPRGARELEEKGVWNLGLDAGGGSHTGVGHVRANGELSPETRRERHIVNHCRAKLLGSSKPASFGEQYEIGTVRSLVHSGSNTDISSEQEPAILRQILRECRPSQAHD